MIDRRSAPGLALAGLLAAAFAVTLSSACTTILYTGPPEGDPVTLIVKNQDVRAAVWVGVLRECAHAMMGGAPRTSGRRSASVSSRLGGMA